MLLSIGLGANVYAVDPPAKEAPKPASPKAAAAPKDPKPPKGLWSEQEIPDAYPLWSAGAPGATGDTNFDKPALWRFPAPADRANGTAVVVCPGGGYGGLALGHEGKDVAEYFNALGVSAYVLRYRHAPRYKHPIPLGDAQRALRTVRANASQWNIDPTRVGIMGFSAGGHLASTLATHFDAGQSDAADPIDRVSCRPDFAILCYPVVAFGTEFNHKGSQKNLLGESPDPALVESLANHKQVTANTPPTFLYHTNADAGVPAENSVLFYLALRQAKVPAELHIYEQGRHGLGLATDDPVLGTWSGRLTDWLKIHSLLEKK
jgi:acetyl esterase/lipase